MTSAQISKALGIAPSTVAYHARMLGIEPKRGYALRYDWDAVQAYHDDGHSKRECTDHFGFTSASWYDAVAAGRLIPRPARRPLSDYLVTGRKVNRFHLKNRLIREGLMQAHCSACGLDRWRGRALSLELHHRNGLRDDNRLENLTLLCPNCHAQTHTWGGRNKRAIRAASAAQSPGDDLPPRNASTRESSPRGGHRAVAHERPGDEPSTR